MILKIGMLGFILVLSGCGKGLSSLTLDVKPSCKLTTIDDGGDCGCDLLLPVDTTKLTGTYLLWPFGIHGGGHPEGHRGWDFLSDVTQDVVAPDDGVVIKFDDSVKDEDPKGTAPYLKLKCGIIVSFQPMRPLASLVVGSHVLRGQKIGEMSPVFGASYSLHFDTRVATDKANEGTICPRSFFDKTRIAKMNTLLASGTWDEKVSHSVATSCTDGSTSAISFPAENELCNARATPANKTALTDCIGSANLSNTGVW